MVFAVDLIRVGISIVAITRVPRTRASWAWRRGLALLLAAGVFCSATTTYAQDATWSLTAATGDWNTAANWVPTTVPTGTASFGSSATTTITFSSNTSVASLQLTALAPAYTLDVSTFALTITGTGVINNSSNDLLIVTNDGLAKFANGSTAGTAIITNNNLGKTTFGTSFVATSTAGNADIINNSGGSTLFNFLSTAGNASIFNAGGAAAFTDSSTAGNATITNNTTGAFTNFFLTSTAGNATIINNSGGLTSFDDSSTAGNSNIVNNSGTTEFLTASTAGNATITNNAPGSFTNFLVTSTAGNAQIVNNSGTVTSFSDASSAGNSTITTNAGGATIFLNSSTGGQARFITNAGGTVDISGLSSTGMTAGSIEGAGTYFLGSKALTVGGNNLSTEVSGVIVDGGSPGGVGGALIKVGTGNLMLTGANTYSGGTTIAAGTLQVGNGGATGSIVGNVIDSGSLIFNRSDSLNFNGIISGAGTLTKLGAGTLILTGSNNYSGGTTISAGTLQIGDGGTAGSIVGNVIDSGSLIFNRSDSLSFNGIISGNGTLTKLGAGTLILTGSNNYSGGTTISAGTLQIGDGGTAGSILGNVINNGSLVFNRSDNQTFSGTIFGTGSLVQSGAGTLILTGNNAYLGGTTVNRGALQIGNGGTTGSISGNVANNGSLSFDRSDSLTVNGIISGTGTVSQNGIGETILSGNNTYLGGTTINAGTLVVNSAQALGLGNVVVNRGILSADPQPINVNGNYAQNPGGTLQLRIGGSAPGQYDLLNVTGRAALGGTLQLISSNGFQPTPGDTLTLIIARGGLTGQFANVIDPLNAESRFGAELVYNPNTVVLDFIKLPFGAFAQTPNEVAVANQLDKVDADPREANLISFLNGQPLANLPGDFEKISPDSLTAIYEISFSAANIQAANLTNRLREIRQGSTGFSSSLSVSNAPGTMTEGKDGKAAIEPSKNVFAPSPENKWGVWISGTGDFISVSGDGNGRGYDFTTGGVTLGIDYRLTRNFAVGIAAGYAHSWTNLSGDGSIDVNSGQGGIYATFYNGGFYLNGYLGGGFNSYDTRRDALVGNAIGSTAGGEFSAFVGGGYEFHHGGWTFGPIASLQYTYADFGGFTESGSLAPLRIESKSENSLRTNLGLSVSYAWKTGNVGLTPTLRAAWQHEYLYSALPIDAQFASGAGSTFTVNGPAEGHDSALINAGVDVQWTPTVGTYFGYDAQVGRSRYDSQGAVCSVHIDF